MSYLICSVISACDTEPFLKQLFLQLHISTSGNSKIQVFESKVVIDTDKVFQSILI